MVQQKQLLKHAKQKKAKTVVRFAETERGIAPISSSGMQLLNSSRRTRTRRTNFSTVSHRAHVACTTCIWLRAVQ